MPEESPDFRKSVAKAISRYCKANGISHEDIARAVGRSKSQVDTWFSRGNFQPRAIRIMHEEFGIPMDIFETGVYEPEKTPTLREAIDTLSSRVKVLEKRVKALEEREA